MLGQLSTPSVYAAQFFIGGAAPFLGPTVTAITLGITGARAFDKQFGKNQAFNSAGNVCTALLIAYVSYRFGYRSIFLVAIFVSIPALLSLFAIDARQINYAEARGAGHNHQVQVPGLSALRKDSVLLYFLLAVLLFHLANAAMLPDLGEMLSRHNPKTAAPFIMSACVIVTQLVITISAAWVGKRAALQGRKALLLVGFGVLPIRGVLCTVTQVPAALIAIQILDGVANSIFVIVSILVIKDRTERTGRSNLASGTLATTVGIGAALSNTIGDTLIQRLVKTAIEKLLRNRSGGNCPGHLGERNPRSEPSLSSTDHADAATPQLTMAIRKRNTLARSVSRSGLFPLHLICGLK